MRYSIASFAYIIVKHEAVKFQRDHMCLHIDYTHHLWENLYISYAGPPVHSGTTADLSLPARYDSKCSRADRTETSP